MKPKLVDIQKEPLEDKENTLERLKKLIELVESDSVQTVGFYHVENGDKNGFRITLDSLPTRTAALVNLAMATRLQTAAHNEVDSYIDYSVENYPVEE
jgi:hypothetical protein